MLLNLFEITRVLVFDVLGRCCRTTVFFGRTRYLWMVRRVLRFKLPTL